MVLHFLILDYHCLLLKKNGNYEGFQSNNNYRIALFIQIINFQRRILSNRRQFLEISFGRDKYSRYISHTYEGEEKIPWLEEFMYFKFSRSKIYEFL